MKTIITICMLALMLPLLIAVAALVLPAVKPVWKQFTHNLALNALSTGTHDDGIISRNADAASSTRYLLVKEGTTAGTTYAICGKTDLPFGIQLDEPAAIGDASAIAVLGAAKGTRLMVASGAITAGVKIYTAAAGKVTSTLDGAQYLVGIALCAAGADGDLIEVSHAVPLLMTSTLTTVMPVVVDVNGCTITSAQSGTVFSTTGSTETATFALPAATVGLHYRFLVEAVQELRIDPDGTETIALATGVQQAAGKYITANAIGESIHIACVSAGTWDVLASNGTWTVEG